MDFPIGAAVTLDELAGEPYERLAELRSHEPVSWVPAIDGWLVTDRDLGIEAMRDAETFTVDDPRFSTAAVLGPSMLSLDGDEHARHRQPFAPSFRPGIVRERFGEFLDEQCAMLLSTMAQQDGSAELRSGLAGPLAVNTITRFLDLVDVTAEEVLTWYHHISKAIEDVTLDRPISDDGTNAVRRINERVAATLARQDLGDSLLDEIARTGALRPEELGSAAAVLMFGAIETAEGMTANAFWHLLSNPDAWDALRDDRSLVADAVEESLRLEPAAAFIDRYTTRDATLGSVTIPKGDLVSISLLAANRDPDLFEDPDRFDIGRANARQHVTFVQGPHGCLGLHLTRMETVAAINAVLDTYPDVRLVPDASTAPAGFIFRKADRVTVELGR